MEIWSRKGNPFPAEVDSLNSFAAGPRPRLKKAQQWIHEKLWPGFIVLDSPACLRLE
jgi:hypothetical protein